MAHPQVGSSIPAKLSFAKIAAMPAPNVTPALPNVIRDSKPRSSGSVSHHVKVDSLAALAVETNATLEPDPRNSIGKITVTMDNFQLDESDVNEPHNLPRDGSTESLTDDQSQVSASSPKQQSFDAKSMASVTTFAMDEKESIRPDDSASVRAVEEDDVHPGLSRNSSFQQEVDAPSNLSRSHVRMLGPNVTIAARRQPYMTLTNPPRFGDLPISPLPDSAVLQTHSNIVPSGPLPDNSRPRPITTTTTPDEKLLEALSSLKDRLPLLQLEEKIMMFINSGRETILELPPQNSFARLLTHKLADYYNLAHHINEENNSVRVFRTEYCALPIPLAELAKSVPIGSQQISQATQVKIMRRVQLGSRQFSAGNSTAASSSVPSKATSENGVETNSEEGLQSPAEGTPSKDRSKLTREEREAQYKAARDRIFGDFQESVTSESGSTGEASASMSRSSSSSGKKKSRKHRTPKDDTFEARSSFIPSYAPLHMQPTYQQVYNDMQYAGAYNSGNYSPGAYSGTMSPNFTSFDPNMAYNNQLRSNAASGGMYGPVDGWQSQQQTPPGNFYSYPNPQPFRAQSINQQMNSQFQQASPIAMQSSPNWAPNQFQGMYMQSSTPTNNGNWQSFNGGSGPGPTPYQYGQLPPQSHAGGVAFANQHPVPGSFHNTKPLFNPQTRSFVPSSGPGRGSARGGRKKGQGPGSTRTSGTSSPAVSNLSESIPTKPKEDSLQQKYGTPANLPKKPPPSQLSPHFSSDHSTTNSGGLIAVNGNGKNSA